MSGDLPRPIKGSSLHHPHGVYNIAGDGGQLHYSPYYGHPFSRPSLPSAQPRPEFAVPVLPQRNRALVVPQAPPSIAGPSSGSKRGRRPHASDRNDAIWSPDVQEAFLQAARSIPNNGKNWIMRDGRQYGRNALIAEEIYRLTGQQRSRQQISSHIQVLKKVHADDPIMMRILNGQLEDLPPGATTNGTAATRFGSNSTSPPAVKTEEPGSSASPPPMPNLDPIEGLMNGQSFMSLVRSSAPGSVASDGSLPGTPKSPPSAGSKDREGVQIAELIPRTDMNIDPISRPLSEPLVADRPETIPHPRAWRGERLAYITAITIWAERTLKDEGVRSRPTTTHVFAQMHSASCPLETLPADMEDIVREIGPGTCMHAEIGIALPAAGVNVGKIRATLVIEAMKEFDGYCLTDAFSGDARFMSTHTTVFPTGREAREKYSWIYEIPYASEVWRKVLKENAQGAHGMRLVQKYVRGLAGGNRDGDLNVPLLVVHDIKVVPPGEAGYSRIKHVDLTGEQAKHDALGVRVLVSGTEDDSDESGDVPMDSEDSEGEKAELGAESRRWTSEASQSQPVTPQTVGWWGPSEPVPDSKVSLGDQMNGILGHALGPWQG